jgi:D-alanyl-lipoteichoic acid acyltransferase DltB (MBOAT superfamily)
MAASGAAPRAGSASASLRGYLAELRAELAPGRLARLGAIAVQFALIVGAIRVLNIETSAFELVATVALGGFLVHHFLPAAWRMGFFAALSIATLAMVLGWADAAWLFGIGCVLIGLCHLPLAMPARIALICAVGVLLAAGRAQLLAWDPVPTVVWPLLGSFFMFRLMIYLYDLKHRTAPFSVERAFAYFFMLPNVCFPLFPIIDYKTFQRSAYSEDALRLYHTGVRWMLRGLVHLLLYKLVYFLGVTAPGEAASGLGVARYMVAGYLLYLKISGTFHLIIGMLHMYGFGLPETHHLYLLSASFTDLWRRVNIYWRDFIQRLVFNPSYFALRKLGEARAMVGATIIASVLTWFLHAYQWFWIRGEFPLVLADVVFWSALGFFLTVNVFLEARRSKKRTLQKPARSWRGDATLCLKTAGTFTVIVVLWTLWTTPSPTELGYLWRGLLNSGPLDIAVLLGIPLGLGVVRVMVGDSVRESSTSRAQAEVPARVFWPQSAVVAAGAAALIVLALRPALLVPVLPQVASLVYELRQGGNLNAADLEKLQRGYYEDLGDVTRFNPELWAMYGGRPKDWNASPQSRERADAIGLEFTPSTSAVFKNAPRTINSLGLRDREYTVQRAPDSFRIALVGASNDMGAGVRDHETYENVAEDRLNRDLAPLTGRRYEILNFSHGGYSPVQKLAVAEARMAQFRPDVMVYVAYSHESDWVFDAIPNLWRHNLLGEYPFLVEAMQRAGIEIEPGKRLPEAFVTRTRLAPYAEQTLRAVLARFRDSAIAAGARPVLVLLELPEDSGARSERFDRMAALAQSLDMAVLDLQGAFSGVGDRRTLWIAPWDSHPNPLGHRLLAERLYLRLIGQRIVPSGRPERPAAAGRPRLE